MANSRIRQVSDNVFTLQFPNSKGEATAALVTFGESDSSYGTGKKMASSPGTFVPWGKKNDQLANMQLLAAESPSKWRLIKARRDFITGLGVYSHDGQESGKGVKTRFTPVIDDDFDAWKELVEWDLEFVRFVLQYTFSGNAFVRMVLDTSKKVVVIETVDAFKCRIVKLKKKQTRVETFEINGNMGTKFYQAADSQFIPAFDPTDPTKYPEFILHLKDQIPGQDFYAFADWWSTESWSKVANKIPKFHDSGLENGYNIKYHISIPDDYFDAEGLDEDGKKALKAQVLQEMGNSLSGVDNVDKVVFTFHKAGINKEAVAGVVITPLKNTMSDDAYTKLYATAREEQASGHGILPLLAGIVSGGTLGGSGKELETAANYQQHYLTYVDRLILLQPLKIIKRINGWDPKLQFDIRNITSYTPDVTPEGTKESQATKSEESNAV